MLQEQGFRVPSEFFLNRRYNGMCAEEIYDKLCKDAKKFPNGSGKGKKDSQGLEDVSFGDIHGKRFDEHYFPNKDPNGKPMSENEVKKLKNEWRKRIVEAETIAKQMGKMPAELERLFGKIIDTKINWKSLLYRYITQEIPYDSTYCIEKNSRIKTSNGHIKIKNIQSNQIILGYKENKIAENKVIKVFEKNIKEKYIIFTKTGKKLICSGEHKILTENGYKKTDELKIGDKILSIKNDNIGTYKRTEKHKEENRKRGLEKIKIIKRCEKCGRLKNDNHLCPTKEEMMKIIKNNLLSTENREKARQTQIKLLHEKKIIPYWKGKRRDEKTKNKISERKKLLYKMGLHKIGAKKGICSNTGRTPKLERRYNFTDKK
jgi:hypothetical protein